MKWIRAFEKDPCGVLLKLIDEFCLSFSVTPGRATEDFHILKGIV
jgi:hypothetical protein